MLLLVALGLEVIIGAPGEGTNGVGARAVYLVEYAR